MQQGTELGHGHQPRAAPCPVVRVLAEVAKEGAADVPNVAGVVDIAKHAFMPGARRSRVGTSPP
eukprot:11393652-Alexandrium_andersonii.AAC.1